MEFAKKFVSDFALLFNASLGIDSNKDKKISFIEVGSLLMVVVDKTMRNYATALDAIQEIQEAFIGPENAPARAELVAVFGDNFDLANDELEGIIEDWLLQSVSVYNLILRTKEIFQK